MGGNAREIVIGSALKPSAIGETSVVAQKSDNLKSPFRSATRLIKNEIFVLWAKTEHDTTPNIVASSSPQESRSSATDTGAKVAWSKRFHCEVAKLKHFCQFRCLLPFTSTSSFSARSLACLPLARAHAQTADRKDEAKKKPKLTKVKRTRIQLINGKGARCSECVKMRARDSLLCLAGPEVGCYTNWRRRVCPEPMNRLPPKTIPGRKHCQRC